jgi:hypothetical protein
MADAIFFKVEYITKAFDLTDPQSAFELIFQLYNFLSAAKTDNDGFYEPEGRLVNAKMSVAENNYSAISKRKREENEKKHSNRNSPSSRGARDSFSNPAVQSELTRVGYTLTQPIPNEFTLLTPVSRNSRCYVG